MQPPEAAPGRCPPGRAARGLAARLGAAGLVGLLGLMGLGGCSRSDADAVKVRQEGAFLVVENHSGRDVHVQLLPDPTAAWLPVSQADNRVQDQRYRRWRIAPSMRGSTVHVAWWHPGRTAEGTDQPGADRVRRVPVPLLALSGELPFDEQVVLACIDALRPWARNTGRTLSDAEIENRCLQEADDCLNTHGMNCDVQARYWKARAADEQARTPR